MTADLLSRVQPITGDPVQIRQGAGGLETVADALETTLAELRSARSGSELRGEAVAAYLEAAEAIVSELAAVQDRYRQTAVVLVGYAATLDGLQQEADRVRAVGLDAAQRAAVAQERVVLAEAEATRAASETVPSGEPLIVLPSLEERAAQDLLDDATADLRQCEDALEALLADWHEAARTCAGQIDEALARSGLNDSGWDVVCAGLEVLLDDVLPELETWLDVIAVVCTVLAVLAVVTGVGAGFAPALFALSRAAQAGARIVAIAKTVATSALVISGRRPPSALVELGAQMVVDRAGGKVADAALLAVARPVGSSVARGMDGAAETLLALDRRGTDGIAYAVATNAASVRAHGFDGWVRDVVDPQLTMTGPVTSASTGPFRSGSAPVARVDSPHGAWGSLEGGAWQVVDVVVETHTLAAQDAGTERKEVTA